MNNPATPDTDPAPPNSGAVRGRSAPPCSQASFDEVWERLRPFLGSDYDTQQAIIVMDHFGWIDNGPCTCGLKIYGDPCPHHDRPENDQDDPHRESKK